MVLDSQKPCRDQRCGAKCIIEGNPYERYCILDSRCQVEMSAGERTVFGDQSPGPQLYLPPHKSEMVLFSADGGHCIKEVCNSTKSLVDGPYQSVGSRLAVSN